MLNRNLKSTVCFSLGLCRRTALPLTAAEHKHGPFAIYKTDFRRKGAQNEIFALITLAFYRNGRNSSAC
jgi:hypothetical protein